MMGPVTWVAVVVLGALLMAAPMAQAGQALVALIVALTGLMVLRRQRLAGR